LDFLRNLPAEVENNNFKNEFYYTPKKIMLNKVFHVIEFGRKCICLKFFTKAITEVRKVTRQDFFDAFLS
jgi:hypothetical protein